MTFETQNAEAQDGTLMTARLRLPSFLEDGQVNLLSMLFEGDVDSYACTRQKDGGNGYWSVALYGEFLPGVDELTDRVNQGLADLGVDHRIAAADWVVEAVPETDWLLETYRQFPAFSIGRFFIYGSHHDGVVPEGLTGLHIDAATAFGSGEHGTTRGCLEALLRLHGRKCDPRRILDMGAGSGILAIAACKIWERAALAVDNDPAATELASRHALLNHVTLRCETGDGFNAPCVAAEGPFDLIFANILAGPLVEMAPALAENLAPGGYTILSGMLNGQAAQVGGAYEAQGLTQDSRIDHDEWTTLVLRKSLPV